MRLTPDRCNRKTKMRCRKEALSLKEHVLPMILWTEGGQQIRFDRRMVWVYQVLFRECPKGVTECQQYLGVPRDHEMFIQICNLDHHWLMIYPQAGITSIKRRLPEHWLWVEAHESCWIHGWQMLEKASVLISEKCFLSWEWSTRGGWETENCPGSG